MSADLAPWAELADEYLNGPAQAGPGFIRGPRILDAYDHHARQNAGHLADLLAHRVDVYGTEHINLSYRGVTWVPVDDPEPYANLTQMTTAWKVAAETGDEVLVSDCYHDHPVFSRLDNLRFRVWHDTGHILEQLDFTPAGELELFKRQARELLLATPSRTTAYALVDALFSESVYQLAACIHLGGFPDVQHVRTPGPVARQLLADWGLS